jgi:hypothetical protein
MKKQSVAKIERRALNAMRCRLAAEFGVSADELMEELRRPSAGAEYAVHLPPESGRILS